MVTLNNEGRAVFTNESGVTVKIEIAFNNNVPTVTFDARFPSSDSSFELKLVDGLALLDHRGYTREDYGNIIQPELEKIAGNLAMFVREYAPRRGYLKIDTLHIDSLKLGGAVRLMSVLPNHTKLSAEEWASVLSDMRTVARGDARTVLQDDVGGYGSWQVSKEDGFSGTVEIRFCNVLAAFGTISNIVNRMQTSGEVAPKFSADRIAKRALETKLLTLKD